MLLERVVREPEQDGGLSDAGVAYQQDLEDVVVVARQRRAHDDGAGWLGRGSWVKKPVAEVVSKKKPAAVVVSKPASLRLG